MTRATSADGASTIGPGNGEPVAQARAPAAPPPASGPVAGTGGAQDTSESVGSRDGIDPRQPTPRPAPAASPLTGLVRNNAGASLRRGTAAPERPQVDPQVAAVLAALPGFGAAAGTAPTPGELAAAVASLLARRRGLTEKLSSTADPAAASELQRQLGALDERLDTGRSVRPRGGGAPQRAYLRIPPEIRVRAASLAKLPEGPPLGPRYQGTAEAPRPGVFLEALQALEARRGRPAGLTEAMWVSARELHERGVRLVDLEHFLAVGQLPALLGADDRVLLTGEQRLAALDAEARRGAWPAINALGLLVNARVAALRAEAARLQTSVGALPAAAPGRALVTEQRGLATGEERLLNQHLATVVMSASLAREATARGVEARAAGMLRQAAERRAANDAPGGVALENEAISRRDAALADVREEQAYRGQHKSFARTLGGLHLLHGSLQIGNAAVEGSQMAAGERPLGTSAQERLDDAGRALDRAGRYGARQLDVLALRRELFTAAGRYHSAWEQGLATGSAGPRAGRAVDHFDANVRARVAESQVLQQMLDLLDAGAATPARRLEVAQLQTDLADVQRGLAATATAALPRDSVEVLLAPRGGGDARAECLVRAAGGAPTSTGDARDVAAVAQSYGTQADGNYRAAAARLQGVDVAKLDTGGRLDAGSGALRVADGIARNSGVLDTAGARALTYNVFRASTLDSLTAAPKPPIDVGVQRDADGMPTSFNTFPNLFGVARQARCALPEGEQRLGLSYLNGGVLAATAPELARFRPQWARDNLFEARDIASTELSAQPALQSQLQMQIGMRAIDSIDSLNQRLGALAEGGLLQVTTPGDLYQLGLGLASEGIPQTPEVEAYRDRLIGLTSAVKGAGDHGNVADLEKFLAAALQQETSALQTDLAPDDSRRINTAGEHVSTLVGIFSSDTTVGYLSEARQQALAERIAALPPERRQAAVEALSAMAAAASHQGDTDRVNVCRQVLESLKNRGPDPDVARRFEFANADFQLQIANGAGAADIYAKLRQSADTIAHPDARRSVQLAAIVGQSNAAAQRIAEGGSPAERIGWAEQVRGLRVEAERAGLGRDAVARMVVMEAQAFLQANLGAEVEPTVQLLEKTYGDLPWVKSLVGKYREQYQESGAAAWGQILLAELNSESAAEAAAWAGIGLAVGAGVGALFFGIGAWPGAGLGALIGGAAGTLALKTRNFARAGDILGSDSHGWNPYDSTDNLLNGASLGLDVATSVFAPLEAAKAVPKGALLGLFTRTGAKEARLLAAKQLGSTFVDFGGKPLAYGSLSLIGVPVGRQLYNIETSDMTEPQKAAARARLADKLGTSLPQLGLVMGGGMVFNSGWMGGGPSSARGLADVVPESTPRVHPAALDAPTVEIPRLETPDFEAPRLTPSKPQPAAPPARVEALASGTPGDAVQLYTRTGIGRRHDRQGNGLRWELQLPPDDVDLRTARQLADSPVGRLLGFEGTESGSVVIPDGQALNWAWQQHPELGAGELGFNRLLEPKDGGFFTTLQIVEHLADGILIVAGDAVASARKRGDEPGKAARHDLIQHAVGFVTMPLEAQRALRAKAGAIMALRQELRAAIAEGEAGPASGPRRAAAQVPEDHPLLQAFDAHIIDDWAETLDTASSGYLERFLGWSNGLSAELHLGRILSRLDSHLDGLVDATRLPESVAARLRRVAQDRSPDFVRSDLTLKPLVAAHRERLAGLAAPPPSPRAATPEIATRPIGVEGDPAAAPAGTTSPARQNLDRFLADAVNDPTLRPLSGTALADALYDRAVRSSVPNSLTIDAASFFDGVGRLASEGRPWQRTMVQGSGPWYDGSPNPVARAVELFRGRALPPEQAAKLDQVFLHFYASGDDARSRLYVNAAGDHLLEVAEFVRTQLGDDPGFIGFKVRGRADAARKADNLLVFFSDDAARERFVEVLAAYHAGHPEHFIDAVPAFVEPTGLSGVGRGTEPRDSGRESYNSVRARALAEAIEEGRARRIDTPEGLRALVDAKLRHYGIDPAQPGRNLQASP